MPFHGLGIGQATDKSTNDVGMQISRAISADKCSASVYGTLAFFE